MIKQISAVLLAFAATGALAQSASGGPLGALQCTGKPVTIRMSIIKPGQLALFKKAVADHQAWYAKNGNGTKVAMVRLTKRAGGALSYDDGTAMTVVTYDAKPQPARDAGYAAFVKAYQDSSTVKDEHRGCLG